MKDSLIKGFFEKEKNRATLFIIIWMAQILAMVALLLGGLFFFLAALKIL